MEVLDVDPSEVLALGDGENDVEMMELIRNLAYCFMSNHLVFLAMKGLVGVVNHGIWRIMAIPTK